MLFLGTRRPATGEALRHETAASGLVMRGRLPPPRAKIVPWGLQGAPPGGRTTVSGARFCSRLMLCLCGHGLVHGREPVEPGMWVRRWFHRHGCGVVPVGDLGESATQCVAPGDALSGFLLGQQAHLQGQLGPLLRQLALAGLGHQDHGGGQQGAEPHEALEPHIRRRVEGGDGPAWGQQVAEYPQRYTEHKAIEKGQPTSQRTHGF